MPPTYLRRVASLVLLSAGALVLMADSAECPDGYTAATYNASFTSTCPTSAAPEQGTVAIALSEGAPGARADADADAGA